MRIMLDNPISLIQGGARAALGTQTRFFDIIRPVTLTVDSRHSKSK